jgi:nucleoside-diphosphate-sugar epimerase
MRVTIIGGSGFIGSTVVDFLLARGDEVSPMTTSALASTLS